MSKQEFGAYNRLEARHWWFRARREILSIFLDSIKTKHKKSVLEIGCGTGGNLIFLLQGFARRTGLEYDEDALAFARNKVSGEVELIQGDANHLEFTSASFDCVVLLDVLCHKNITDVKNVLTQVYNILKPGGCILISDGAFNFLQGRHSASVDSVRRFTLRGLSSQLSDVGFEIIKSSYWGVSLFLLLFVRRSIIERLQFRGNINVKAGAPDLVQIPIVDTVLFCTVALEKHLIRRARLPFGASLCCLAKKHSI